VTVAGWPTGTAKRGVDAGQRHDRDAAEVLARQRAAGAGPAAAAVAASGDRAIDAWRAASRAAASTDPRAAMLVRPAAITSEISKMMTGARMTSFQRRVCRRLGRATPRAPPRAPPAAAGHARPAPHPGRPPPLCAPVMAS